MSDQTESIQFQIATPANLTGLEQTIAQLKNLREIMRTINLEAVGTKLPKVTSADVEGMLKSLKGGISASSIGAVDLARQLGQQFSAQLGREFGKSFEAALPELKQKFPKAFSGDKFRSAPQAAEVTASFLDSIRRDVSETLTGVLAQVGKISAKVPVVPSSAAPKADAGQVKVALGDGIIALPIPVNRIVATLGEGTITLSIPPGAVRGTSDGGGQGAPGTPESTPTAPRKGIIRKRSGGSGGTEEASVVDGSGNEIRRVTRVAGDKVTESVTSFVDALTRQTVNVDDKGEVSSTVTVQSALQRFRLGIKTRVSEMLQQYQDALGKAEAGVSKSDVLRMRAKAARELQVSLLSLAEREAASAASIGAGLDIEGLRLRASTAGRSAASDTARAERAERAGAAPGKSRIPLSPPAAFARVVESRRAAAARREQEAFLAEQGIIRRSITAEAGRSELDRLIREEGFQRGPSRISRRQPRGGGGEVQTQVEEVTRDSGGERQGRRLTTITQDGRVVSTTLDEINRKLKGTQAEVGALSGDFVTNTAKVTAWAASVGVLYQALGAVSRAGAAVVDTNYQVARLTAILDGTSVSARGVTSDLLAMASAEGRSRDEALQSGVAWARVLRSRKEIREAVRVSLVAANVSDQTAAESADNQIAIYQSYGLKVSQLSGLLGQLNEVSNTTSATVGELFRGLSKVAAVAAESNVPLSELIGYLGAVISQTKQSGANVGNALKTIIGRVASPELLGDLRDRFALDLFDPSGQQKDFRGTLDEIYSAYNRLGRAEREALLVRTAGNNQLTRAASLLDNYIKAQVLALNTQLATNSASKENEKIHGTMRNSMASLVAEFERFAVIQGDNGVIQLFTAITKGLKGILVLLNDPTLSKLTTGAIALGGAALIRGQVSRMMVDAQAGKAGIVGRTIARGRQLVTAAASDIAGGFGSLVGYVSGRPAAAAGAGAGAGSAVTGAVAGAGLARLAAGAAPMVRAGTGAGALVAAGGLWSMMLDVTSDTMKRFGDGFDEFIEEFDSNIQRFAAGSTNAAGAIRTLELAIRTAEGATGNRRKGVFRDVAAYTGFTAEERDKLKSGAPESTAILQAARDRAVSQEALEQERQMNALLEKRAALEIELGRIRGNADPNQIRAKEDDVKATTAAITELQEARLRRQVGGSTDSGQALFKERLDGFLKQLGNIRSAYSEVFSLGQSGNAVTQLTNRTAAQRAYLSALREEKARLDEVAESHRKADDAAEGRLETLMREEADVVERISRITGGASDASLSEADAAQVRQLRSAKARIQSEQTANAPRIDTDGFARSAALAQEIRSAQSELRQLEASRAAAEFQASVQAAARAASSYGSRFDYGNTETERLRNRVAGLQEAQQGEIEKAGSGSKTDRTMSVVRALEYERQIHEALLSLQERTNRLRGEELQLLQDRRREFERSVLLSSPEDLLKRMAAARLSSGGPGKLSAGQFFAAGDLRQMILDQPGFGFDEARLRRERALIDGMGPGVDRRLFASDGIQGVLAGTMQGLVAGQLPANLSAGSESIQSFASQIQAITDGQLAAFGVSMEAAAYKLGELATKVDSINKIIASGGSGSSKNAPVNPQALGLQAGR